MAQNQYSIDRVYLRNWTSLRRQFCNKKLYDLTQSSLNAPEQSTILIYFFLFRIYKPCVRWLDINTVLSNTAFLHEWLFRSDAFWNKWKICKHILLFSAAIVLNTAAAEKSAFCRLVYLIEEHCLFILFGLLHLGPAGAATNKSQVFNR